MSLSFLLSFDHAANSPGSIEGIPPLQHPKKENWPAVEGPDPWQAVENGRCPCLPLSADVAQCTHEPLEPSEHEEHPEDPHIRGITPEGIKVRFSSRFLDLARLYY